MIKHSGGAPWSRSGVTPDKQMGDLEADEGQ
jgi:hypothetical protein